MRLTQMSSGDLGLGQQLSSFQYNKDWYTLPESVRNGIPVFALSSSSCSDIRLIPRDVSCLKFITTWQPICQLETNSWRKWFHTHKVSLILKHDNPLPKYLHMPNSAQRFQVVQCRQAATALYGMLADWASFVLVDNHTYLKLLYKEQDKPPLWFCIVRVSSKFPCAVLNIGFLTWTPGVIRYDICEELKTAIALLSYLSSPMKSKENFCCVLLQKPLEKILIRYERIPSNFTTVIFPDGTQPRHSTLSLPSSTTGSLFTTLSRYLYHKRWIWSATHSTNPKLPDQSISRILNTLTRMRIREGFSFAHSSSGVITMVLELSMETNATCVVQYVLFPPHRAWLSDDLYSGSEEENEQSSDVESEMQIVTEVWIEPQYGKVLPSNPRISYIDHKHYYEIADVISKIDLQCINALLTMEHLSLMCQERNIDNQVQVPSLCEINPGNTSRKTRKNSRNGALDSPALLEKGSQWYPIVTPRIEHIPFKFDPINILPLCQQTELLFSMFIEGKEKSYLPDCNVDKANSLLLNNVIEHLGLLHDRELELTKDDSDRFTQVVLLRHKNKHPHTCPLAETHLNSAARSFLQETEVATTSQWRCFIKGVSVTHVILTFVASTLDDLKSLTSLDHTNIPSLAESIDSTERTSSRESNYSDVPINTSNSVCLPIYVFDCPLSMLVNAYINSAEDSTPVKEDVYEDHRFKFNGFVQEDCVKLKSDETCDILGDKDELEPPERSNIKHHCKTLVLTHTKCFTISLFLALHMGVYVHSHDVQSAMDQCEESITEIDITEYITIVCGHVKQKCGDKIPIKELHQAFPCSELKSLHMLIKEKFFKIINAFFNPIPTNSEFYFYKNLRNIQYVEETTSDSDDEISNTPSEIEFKSDKDFSIFSEGPHLYQRMESGINDIVSNSDVNPLFLHLICTLRYNNGEVSNTSFRVLPTCLGELIQSLDPSTEYLHKSKLQVTLDILCLTLPPDVQNIINDYSTQGMRTTSFCSDGFQPSIQSSISDTSITSDFPEPLKHLSDMQKRSIISLREEIKWLLQDEICTSLLDVESVTAETLGFVMKHVMEATPLRSSCVLDIIDLNFVYASAQSHEKFVQEFSKLKLPYVDYVLCKEAELHYLVKNNSQILRDDKDKDFVTTDLNVNGTENVSNRVDPSADILIYSRENPNNKSVYKHEVNSQQSDISSVNGSERGTDGGYDEDVSEDYDDYDWLINLNNKRKHLPNFWLILKIEQEVVTVYFHCRFLELPTNHVGVYLEIQRDVCEAVRDLCKKVNQLLLLQSLYETRTCDSLLESDDNWHSDVCSSPISRNTSYCRLKSMDENSDEQDLTNYPPSLSEASLHFKAGYFSCPVVWETHFVLHPRLKTGPGKSGISRGILALKNILDKFSVSNRNNMFVYRDNQKNVFYLRLHENVHSPNKAGLIRSSEYENATVSRSPSITSLPLGQNKNSLTQSEQSITSVISGDIRPRVRSFGEKESKDSPNEDTLILKVHGITEAGTDVQQDLVQVLQNRLDDAVLEFLSIMLARNAMCPLTPEDVHFIQKPFRLPEVIIKLTIRDFALQWLDSFVHYLKQNLLQFLNIPKYTDTRSHYHFKDYSESEDSNSLVNDDNIFIYNQGQNPSSGNRGIACIVLALVNNNEKSQTPIKPISFEEIFQTKEFEETVTSDILTANDECPDTYLEFRLWKQGRVNIENLSQKLKGAVSQASWDIVTEYFLLKKPLCMENVIADYFSKKGPVRINSLDIDFSKEIEFNCILELNTGKNVKESICNSGKRKEHFLPRNKRNRRVIPPNTKTMRSVIFDETTSDTGVLSDAYSKYLPNWLEFGFSINTPSVKKQRINLANRHLPNIVIGELMNMLPDSPKAFSAIPTNCLKNRSGDIFVPYIASNLIQKFVIISRNFDQWLSTISVKDSECPDTISPQVLKHSQKFVPAIANNTFIPRQKILWISVETDNIIVFTYNWAKDSIDKLISSCSNLGQWLCVRSCFLNSVTSQKLGLFHNQPLTRKCFMIPNNPYSALIGNSECMMTFPKEHSHRRIQPAYNLPSTLEAFRDNFHNSKYVSADPVVTFTLEMREMKLLEKKSRDEMKILHAMYQSRTSTTTVSHILLLMQNSRIVHYCHTPLLFLPRWRLKSAATRDHSLHPSQAVQLADKMASEEKEKWHNELCYGFFIEYRHYLQTLGFMPLQIDNSSDQTGMWTKDKSSYNSVFYIQKTILGGILIFTVEFNEPFFITKLHAIECNRLQNISSRASINRFTVSFLDECDRVKILMHLHSFTYDYHLRCIYNYISNNPGLNKVCERYNVHQFLDDFLKYYNKAPNFARNLVHTDLVTDTLTIKNLVTEGQQLYEYLLSNVSQYNFKVFEMDLWEGESEFILVQVTSTPQVSYKDSQDRHHTDDFDITLVVYNLCTPYHPSDNVLHLKYYLILTSKRELYPKCEVEDKLGKFRTVSSNARSLSAMGKAPSELETSVEKTVNSEIDCDITSSDEHISFSSKKPSKDTLNNEGSSSQQSNSVPYIEIYQESVNYLGYYSSHEQLMQQLILDKANTTQKHIKDMVAKGMVHCRTHLLWNRLISPQETNNLTYEEFMELKSLAKLEHLCNVHPNLGPLLNQPLTWYQGLAKLLLVKYVDQSRSFISADGNIQHYVILHPRYFGAFMLLSMDLHTSRGDLYAVYREPHKHEDADLCLAYQKSLLDGFINCICFYLWSGMISN
ncbi:KICSTOR complex protein SZT2 isoform X1 [Anoplophora glabripennis]|nr:KICSTOR complex protein SZT2 isoform X1 [Anoplophora glabripennis]